MIKSWGSKMEITQNKRICIKISKHSWISTATEGEGEEEKVCGTGGWSPETRICMANWTKIKKFTKLGFWILRGRRRRRRRKMTLLKGAWVGGVRFGVGGGGGVGGMGDDSSEFDSISRDEHLSSVHSIRSGILPSLGSQSTRSVKLRPFTINPLHHRYRFLIVVWLSIRFLIYEFLSIPCTMELIRFDSMQTLAGISSRACVLHSLGFSIWVWISGFTRTCSLYRW